MFDSRPTSYTEYGLATVSQPAVLGRVLGLLGFAFVFTAAGAVIGQRLGAAAFFLALIGTFGTLIALMLLKERSPLNLALLYGFATFRACRSDSCWKRTFLEAWVALCSMPPRRQPP